MKTFVSIFLTLAFVSLVTAGLDNTGQFGDVVAIYHFENANDSGPRGFNGSLRENATIVDNGKINKCLQLQNKDWFGLVDELFLGIISEFSIVAWVKLPQQTKDLYMAMTGINDDNTLEGDVALYVKPSGNIEGFVADFADSKSSTTLSENQNVSDNRWHHIAFTKYADTYFLFVDGETVKKSPQTRYIGFVGDDTFVSISSSDRRTTNLTGSVLIDEVAFFEIGFSVYEIKAIYDNGLPDFLEAMPVDPQEKVATTWANIKQIR